MIGPLAIALGVLVGGRPADPAAEAWPGEAWAEAAPAEAAGA